MSECNRCKTLIRGESGIRCNGVCGKVYHVAVKCSSIDSSSYNALITNSMIKYICDDCITLVHDIDLIMSEIKESINKNSNLLIHYKSDFEVSLKKCENELKLLLESIEAKYDERLKNMKIAQTACENTVLDMKKLNKLSERIIENQNKKNDQKEKNRVNCEKSLFEVKKNE